MMSAARSPRPHHSASERRLAFSAAHLELRTALARHASAYHASRVAKAEFARARAEAAAGRIDGPAVADAGRRAQAAQRELKAAAAAVRACRAREMAERAAVPPRDAPEDAMPLTRLRVAHEQVTTRWLAYETDPGRVLAFPTMSDARVPSTARFLAELSATQRLRPASSAKRVTAAEFSAYRAGIERLREAFDEAERDAWRTARAAGTAPAGGPHEAGPRAVPVDGPTWLGSLEGIAARSADVIARAAEIANVVAEAGRTARRSWPTTPGPSTHR
jgi:hypothetical protein